jgi:hypothetical protein
LKLFIFLEAFMKFILTAVMASVVAFQSGSARANDVRDCDIANEVFCPVPLNKNSIFVAIHNSGRPGRCGIKILTNKNFAFSSQGRLFADGIEAKIGRGSDSTALSVRQIGNGFVIADTSESAEGKLPHFFIVPLTVNTKTGETLESLAKRTIGSSNIEPGEVALAIVPIECEND